MNPIITQVDSFKLVGLRAPLRLSKDQPNDVSGIAMLWKQLRDTWSQISNRVGTDRFAIITGDYSPRLDEAYYYALVQVEDFDAVPEGFEHMDLSGRRLAFFRHQGSVRTSGQTAMKVLREWLPASGEHLSDNMEICRFDAAFDPRSDQGGFDFGICI